MFKDYAGNTVNVTFVNTGSHTDGTAVTGANGSRKISAGNYELNTNGLSSTASTANSEVTTDFKILEAARDAGEINFTRITIADTEHILGSGADVATSGWHAPLSVMVERALALGPPQIKTFFVSTYGTNTNVGIVQAEISSINEPVYTIYNALIIQIYTRVSAAAQQWHNTFQIFLIVCRPFKLVHLTVQV